MLFDEIEKASDALWQLLLGILDKGTLTLGDNRKVDFSRAMIFMTSNLGAAEMSTLDTPRLGFHVACSGDDANQAKLNGKITTAEASGQPASPVQVTGLGQHTVIGVNRHSGTLDGDRVNLTSVRLK